MACVEYCWAVSPKHLSAKAGFRYCSFAAEVGHFFNGFPGGLVGLAALPMILKSMPAALKAPR